MILYLIGMFNKIVKQNLSLHYGSFGPHIFDQIRSGS
jgi:hypothetical protein